MSKKNTTQAHLTFGKGKEQEEDKKKEDSDSNKVKKDSDQIVQQKSDKKIISDEVTQGNKEKVADIIDEIQKQAQLGQAQIQDMSSLIESPEDTAKQLIADIINHNAIQQQDIVNLTAQIQRIQLSSKQTLEEQESDVQMSIGLKTIIDELKQKYPVILKRIDTSNIYEALQLLGKFKMSKSISIEDQQVINKALLQYQEENVKSQLGSNISCKLTSLMQELKDHVSTKNVYDPY